MGTLLSAGAFREHPWDLPQLSPPLGLCTWLSGALIPASPLLLCSRGFTQGASPHLSLSFLLSGSGGAPFWVLGHLLIPVAAASSFSSSVHPLSASGRQHGPVHAWALGSDAHGLQSWPHSTSLSLTSHGCNGLTH